MSPVSAMCAGSWTRTGCAGRASRCRTSRESVRKTCRIPLFCRVNRLLDQPTHCLGSLMRLVLAWLVMLIVSVVNGIARDIGYGSDLDPLLAQQLSTLYGMTLLGVVIAAYTWRWPFAGRAAAWRAGLLWLAMTVAFEFLFFHYVTGHSWSELLANYNLAAGRPGMVLLASIGMAPALCDTLFRRLRP